MELIAAVIGIDPGANGGVAVVTGTDAMAWKLIDMTTIDVSRLFVDLRSEYGVCVAYMEKVNPGPKMGSSASFKFGRSVGMIHMAVVAAGIRFEFVSPQKWQKELSLIVSGRGLGQGDTAKKNRNKAMAQELFPSLKITHAIADALLIAEYGRRVECGRI